MTDVRATISFIVDYGNLHRIDSERGVEFFVSMLLNRLDPSTLENIKRVRFRLYHGWYEGDQLTKAAQNVVRQIDEAFPNVIDVAGQRLLVAVELARSLVHDPANDLLHTYRPRQFPGNVKCVEAPFEGCARYDDCPIVPIINFVNNKSCNVDGCSVRPRKIFIRPEQKLVDSMMVADLMTLASKGEPCVVVSSDDDIWPGISAALEFGYPVIHVQSKPGQFTPESYVAGVAENYVAVAYEAI